MDIYGHFWRFMERFGTYFHASERRESLEIYLDYQTFLT